MYQCHNCGKHVGKIRSDDFKVWKCDKCYFNKDKNVVEYKHVCHKEKNGTKTK